MNVVVLTSSRADFGILTPLLRKLDEDKHFSLKIIAFGTHNSPHFGNTVKEIEQAGFKIYKKVAPLRRGSGPEIVSYNIGTTYRQFSEIWKTTPTDLIVCLGDRYEMFAAVGASVPFNIKVAHISGGEVTEGAIDNVYRNALTLMATYHFASTEAYKKNIVRIRNSSANVYNVGALSIDNLKGLQLYSKAEFLKKFGIDLEKPSVLITFHPETVSYQQNEAYVSQLTQAMEQLDNYQLIITMPNADTMGQVVRQKLKKFIAAHANAVGVESFGMLGYLSCMKHCSFMMGNTSSGFVEASFFPKPVINLGDRQKGRIKGGHIIDCPIEKKAILRAVKKAGGMKRIGKQDIYGKGDSAAKIMRVLRSLKSAKENQS